MSLYRLGSTEILMSQKLFANMLGVRREWVAESAGKLQKLGLSDYSRGRIVVLDRSRVEKHACECYQVVKKTIRTTATAGEDCLIVGNKAAAFGRMYGSALMILFVWQSPSENGATKLMP